VVDVGAYAFGQCDVGNWTDIVQVAAGEYDTVGLKSDGTVVAVVSQNSGQCDVGGWTDIVQVAAGMYHTVGLNADGTVVAVGSNYCGQCNVSDWTDIDQIAAAADKTVGLKSDGTVVAVGLNWSWGQCNVASWTDIVQVAAGWQDTVGLKSDGSVVGAGWNYVFHCDVGNWTGINQTAAGSSHTVGLKGDGTVVAVGDNYSGECNVGNWADIVQVAAGMDLTVGLKADGTVVAVGLNDDGQCDVGGWRNIVQVATSWRQTVGLKADGTVVAVGDNTYGQCNVGGWTDIIQVAAGESHTVGLKSDGTVVAVGNKWYGQRNVGAWGNITQIAAGAAHTLGLKADGTVVAAGPEIELAKWNLVLAVPPSQSVQLGVKAGDWIKIEYKITGWPAGQPYPEWLKLEFLSVEGTSANVRATMRMSDGTEQSDTVPVDVGAGGGEAFGLSGFVISANLTTGDYVYITGYGNVAIEGETTRTYAGARRTVVYASISQSVPYQGEVQLTYYWDKLTGVMVESSTTYADITATAKATETHMWEATTGLCFIATAAYGTPMAEEIEILREFRDQYLLTNSVGRAFIDFYYKVSPPIAEFITRHPSLKPVVRAGLLPIVVMSKVIFDIVPQFAGNDA
jgi:alpha-tubulin suppressor-like RCC1 family protein